MAAYTAAFYNVVSDRPTGDNTPQPLLIYYLIYLIFNSTKLRLSYCLILSITFLLLQTVFYSDIPLPLFVFLLSTTQCICPKYGEIQTGMYFFCVHQRPGTVDNECE